MSAPQTFAVDVKNLTKRYAGKAVVENLCMQVRRGEIFGFLGPNGSGKTTSIRMLCGLLSADAGEGKTLGYDIRTESSRIKREVGYMTQRFSLYEDLSIRENLEFIAAIYEMPSARTRIDQAIEGLGLYTRQKQLAGSLSGGWKQRLALSACMLHDPQLLLLDEPTAGVDPKARREFWDEIHRLAASGITVLVSTHYMDEAERCHRLGYIAYGKLMACGTPQELIRDSGLTTWAVTGEGLSELAETLEKSEGVQRVTRFGNALHISGTNAPQLEKAISPWRGHLAQHWVPQAPELEDVFIHLMSQSVDNFGPGR